MTPPWLICLLIQAAADAGCKQFVFVSVHDYKAPSVVKKVGYFDGKRRTEKVVGELFGEKARETEEGWRKRERGGVGCGGHP